MTDPIRPTDDEARSLARALLDDADHCALGVLEPESGAPMVTRIALTCDAEGRPLTLVSSLSAHSKAMAASSLVSLLVGAPGAKGDALTHPRLTLQARAEEIHRDAQQFPALRDHYLGKKPKSKLFIDFGDFYLVRFHVTRAFLNGGFGRAFHLTPADLKLPEAL